MENKIVTRDVVLEIRELTPAMIENREAEFVISSEAVDTYDTIFVAEGCELERYNNNPIVAYGHRTWSDDPDMILGTSQVRQEGKLTIGKVRFEDAETNPTAEKVFKKIQAGTLRMASIGANVLEWRFGDAEKGENPGVIYFTRWELLEWSIVPIGSNKDALVRNAQTIEEMRTALIKEIPVADATDATGETINLSVRERQHKLNLKKSF
jgi:HK97 family phage prohead protease